MAKLVDPDSLNRNTEIIFDVTGSPTFPRYIQLDTAGNLNDNSPGQTSGVTLQAVYSKCKELWKSETDLGKLRFPFDPITEAKMDLVRDWDFADVQTRDLIRDAGWSLRDGSGNSKEEYACLISLGSFDSDLDQAYYANIAGFDQSTINFDKTGALNEPIKIFGDADKGSVNFRGYQKSFLRIQGKLYDQYNLLVEQGLASLDYTVFRLPLSNASDIKVTNGDAFIDANPPYTGMSIGYVRGALFHTWQGGFLYSVDDVVLDPNDSRWYRCITGHTSSTADRSDTPANWESYPGERLIGSTYYAFNRVVEGNDGTAEQIYEYTQRQLRRITDINDDIGSPPGPDNFGTVNGTVALPLLTFLGDTLQTQGGVFIDGFNANDTNRIDFFDITVDGGGLDSESAPVTSTVRNFPFVAAGTLVFNDLLVNDAAAEYRMFFDTNPGGDFDTTSAIVVNDNGGSPIEGSITQTSISFDFDYDGNNQGGRTPGTDADIVLVAIGLDGAQWVSGSFTITRTTGLSFPVNAAQERVYSNP